MSALAVTGIGMTAAAQAPAAAPVTPAVAPASATAAPSAAAAAAPGAICGNQPFCYDASDFAATVTDFRTTAQGGYKIIDVTMRFINKTTTPLSFGYANGSGMATDDRGNRYAVGGPNGFRGIGLVNGTTFDPKFTVRPGGYGDARFELLFAPGQAIIGSTFELDLTVNEINSVEGNQHTLGGEFPLEFKSLVNGSTGPAPAAVTYSSAGQVASAASAPPCAPAGTAANATNSTTNGATTAINNTATAVSSIGSLFGAKKPAANSSAAAPCTAASPTASSAANTTAAAPGATAAAKTTTAVPPATAAAVGMKAPTTAAPAAAAAKAPTPATTTAAAPPKTTTPATTAAVVTKAPAATPATGKAPTPPAATPATSDGALTTTPPKSQTP